MKTLHPVILPVPAHLRKWAGPSTADGLSDFARTALSRSAGLSDARLGPLEKNEAGAPLPTGGWHWSVSHKTTYAGGVVSRGPVGMDIEQVRDVHPGLFEKTATLAEWDLMPRTTANLFRFWTAKEAVLKANATGLGGLPNCRVITVTSEEEMVVSFHRQRFTVRQHFFAGHLAAITDADDAPIQWHIDPA